MAYQPIRDPVFGDRYKTWLNKHHGKQGDVETTDLLIELYYALIDAKARIKQLEDDAEAPF